MTKRLSDEDIERLALLIDSPEREKKTYVFKLCREAADALRQLLEERRLMKRPVKTSTDTGPLQKSSWHISRWGCPRCNARVAPQDEDQDEGLQRMNGDVIDRETGEIVR